MIRLMIYLSHYNSKNDLNETNLLTKREFDELIPNMLEIVKSNDYNNLSRQQKRQLITNIFVAYYLQKENGNPNPFPQNSQIPGMIEHLRNQQPKPRNDRFII